MTGLCLVLLLLIPQEALEDFVVLAKRLDKVLLVLFQVDLPSPQITEQVDQEQLSHQEREEFQILLVPQVQLRQDLEGTLTTTALNLQINKSGL